MCVGGRDRLAQLQELARRCRRSIGAVLGERPVDGGVRSGKGEKGVARGSLVACPEVGKRLNERKRQTSDSSSPCNCNLLPHIWRTLPLTMGLNFQPN